MKKDSNLVKRYNGDEFLIKKNEIESKRFLEMSEEDFKKLEKDSSYDFELEDVKKNHNLYESYMNIIDMLKEYCDLKKEDYPLIATWIIGTYLHEEFISYPFLFLNAVKGAGKTRALKLITKLSKDGEILLSPTEAVLFRTKSTLGIDEFEGIGVKSKNRTSMDNIRELLNACYKKGSKVKRMKQKKTMEGTEQVVEEFDVYRPIILANITGMEEVLSDRCITIILDKSNNQQIVNRIEIYEHSEIFKKTLELLNQCSLCSVVSVLKVYIEWNNYLDTNINTTLTTQTTYNTQTTFNNFFNKIKEININGRDLEITLPLMIIANEIGENVFDDVLNSIKKFTEIKREDQFVDSLDVIILDFVSQEVTTDFQSIKNLTTNFNNFAQLDYPINSKSFGRALVRLGVVLDNKRVGGGVMKRLDIKKAQKQLEVYK